MAQESNRREFTRVSVHIEAEITSNETSTVTGKVCNVSMNGLSHRLDRHTLSRHCAPQRRSRRTSYPNWWDRCADASGRYRYCLHRSSWARQLRPLAEFGAIQYGEGTGTRRRGVTNARRHQTVSGDAAVRELVRRQRVVHEPI